MLAVLVFAGGLVVIAYQVYRLNEFRMELYQPQEQQASPVLQTKSAAASEGAGLGQLAKGHLMGQPNQKPIAPVEKPVVVDTSLKLDLVGTIRGGPADKDSALIQAAGKETKRYYVGEQIEGGAVLHAVNEDSIILKRGGALETLRYSKTEQVLMPATSRQAAGIAGRITSTPATAPRIQPGVAPNGDNAGTPQQPKSLRERLRLRQKSEQAKQQEKK